MGLEPLGQGFAAAGVDIKQADARMFKIRVVDHSDL